MSEREPDLRMADEVPVDPEEGEAESPPTEPIPEDDLPELGGEA